MNDPARSYERMTNDDFRRLGRIASADREEFFSRKEHYAPLADYILAVALCQGAALHYVNGTNGIKDIDVWTFYAEHPTITYPPRRPIIPRDFGDPKFGKTRDYEHFVGRKVDCLGRSLSVQRGSEPVGALRGYLANPRTDTAGKLAEKGVVLIEPAGLLGTVVWPVQ
jgi:hypothetical protein